MPSIGVTSVTEALQILPDVSNVEVNLENGEVSYQGNIDSQTVKDAIHKIGFEN